MRDDRQPDLPAGLFRATLGHAANDLAVLFAQFGLDLRRGDGAGADLRGVHLAEAQLTHAQLAGSLLSGASLMRADLAGACLDGAELVEADLSSADLRGGSFRHADLRWGNLSHARIEGADFTGARLEGARLEGIDVELLRAAGADMELRAEPGSHAPGVRGADPFQPLELRFPVEEIPALLAGLMWRIAALSDPEDEEWFDLIPTLAADDAQWREMAQERARLERITGRRGWQRARALRLVRLYRDLAMVNWFRGAEEEALAHARGAIAHAERTGFGPARIDALFTGLALALSMHRAAPVAGEEPSGAPGRVPAPPLRTLAGMDPVRDAAAWQKRLAGQALAPDQQVRATLLVYASAILRGDLSVAYRAARSARQQMAGLEQPGEQGVILFLLEQLLAFREGEWPDMRSVVARIGRRDAIREPYRSFLAAARAPAPDDGQGEGPSGAQAAGGGL